VTLLVGAVAFVVVTRDGRGSCSSVVHERLDPRSLQHVLPGTPPPSYPSAAPTSGPHQVGFVEGGIRREPLGPALQVGVLESGGVLIQHRPEVTREDLLALEAVAGGRVVVAPNPALDSAVVATAWQVRMRCSRVDAGALVRFARSRQGPVAGGDHAPGAP